MSSGQLDRFYAARVVVALAVLWLFRQGYASWNWSWSWFAVAIGTLVYFVWIALEPVTRIHAGASGNHRRSGPGRHVEFRSCKLADRSCFRLGRDCSPG